jgi:glycosyltransferase involved in cell wall biosynthesis
MTFSIIMPYYKHLKTIKRALQSVLTQLEQDFEIIIIDDGSKDNVLSLINEFNDKRIMYLESEHLGVSHARNFGIKQAKGDYICFLDSDDFYMNHHLAVLKKQIDRNPYSNFFVTNHHQLSKKSNPFKALKFKDEILKVKNYFEFTLNKMEVIHTNSVCIKKDILKDHLFEEGISHGEDHDLWCRLAIFNEIIFINHVTTVYDNQESILTNIKEVPRWVFIDRQDQLNTLKIEEEIKNSLNIFIERKKLTEVRKLIKYRQTKEARKTLKELRQIKGIIFPFIITKIAITFPFMIKK